MKSKHKEHNKKIFDHMQEMLEEGNGLWQIEMLHSVELLTTAIADKNGMAAQVVTAIISSLKHPTQICMCMICPNAFDFNNMPEAIGIIRPVTEDMKSPRASIMLICKSCAESNDSDQMRNKVIASLKHNMPDVREIVSSHPPGHA